MSKQQYKLRPSRVICDICTQAASPSVIEQANKRRPWGVFLGFVSDKGEPLPMGIVICARCYQLLKQTLVAMLPNDAKPTAQAVDTKEGENGQT
jgi:hypothetical protein